VFLKGFCTAAFLKQLHGVLFFCELVFVGVTMLSGGEDSAIAAPESSERVARFGGSQKRCSHFCCLTVITHCCACSDNRVVAIDGLYECYVDGKGDVREARREAWYCEECKETARRRDRRAVAAAGPPVDPVKEYRAAKRAARKVRRLEAASRVAEAAGRAVRYIPSAVRLAAARAAAPRYSSIEEARDARARAVADPMFRHFGVPSRAVVMGAAAPAVATLARPSAPLAGAGGPGRAASADRVATVNPSTPCPICTRVDTLRATPSATYEAACLGCHSVFPAGLFPREVLRSMLLRSALEAAASAEWLARLAGGVAASGARPPRSSHGLSEPATRDAVAMREAAGATAVAGDAGAGAESLTVSAAEASAMSATSIRDGSCAAAAAAVVDAKSVAEGDRAAAVLSKPLTLAFVLPTAPATGSAAAGDEATSVTSATTTAFAKAVDQLACPVCLDPFVDPVTLPACGHSFCRVCVHRLAASAAGAGAAVSSRSADVAHPAVRRLAADSIACPCCRTVNTGVSALPVSRELAFAVGLLGSMRAAMLARAAPAATDHRCEGVIPADLTTAAAVTLVGSSPATPAVVVPS
jgi:hypothetical protein